MLTFRRAAVSALILALLALGSRPQAATPDTSTVSRLTETVRTLAADEYEGRGIGTDGLKKASEYVANAFKQARLNVLEAGGDPFQEFDVVDGAKLGSPNTLTFRGPEGKSIDVKMGPDFEVCSFGDAGKFDAPIVFAGYGIESTDPVYNDFDNIDIKGKVVILLRRNPQQGNPHGLFSAGGPHGTGSRHAALRTKVSNAFRRGAAAIVFVNDIYTGRSEAEKLKRQLAEAEDAVAKAGEKVEAAKGDEERTQAQKVHRDAVIRVEQTREVLADHKLDPLMEFGYGGPRSGQAVPIVHITQKACSELFTAALGKSLEQIETEIDDTGKPHSAELKGWTARGETNVTVQKVDIANVIAVLNGEGPHAAETIVIGAHYDHIGYGGENSLAPGSKEIHNGADDNASGTAALIELARRFAARPQKPARRLVFIAFTGEERGLLGSAHYVKEPLFPLDSTVAMFNMDMVGRLQDDKLTVFGTGTSNRWKDLLNKAAEPSKLTIIEKPEGFGPSDHSSFYGKQIPVLHLFTGTHNDYHRPGDDSDKINYEGIARVVDYLERIVDDTLARPERPGYVEIQQKATIARTGSRPYFGSIPDFGTENPGYALQGVSPGSPADKAGLQAGDVIIQVGEDKIGSLDDFDLALRKFSPGQQVQVIATRNGKPETFQVILGTPRG